MNAVWIGFWGAIGVTLALGVMVSLGMLLFLLSEWGDRANRRKERKHDQKSSI